MTSEAPETPKRTHGGGALLRGSRVIWPAGLQVMLGISAPTRWRWEKDGKLPARDVNFGGRTGWRAETIEAYLARDAR